MKNALETLKEEIDQGDKPGEKSAFIKTLRSFAQGLYAQDLSGVKTEFHSNMHDIYFIEQEQEIEIHYFAVDPLIPPVKLGILEFIYFLEQCAIERKGRL